MKQKMKPFHQSPSRLALESNARASLKTAALRAVTRVLGRASQYFFQGAGLCLQARKSRLHIKKVRASTRPSSLLTLPKLPSPPPAVAGGSPGAGHPGVMLQSPHPRRVTQRHQGGQRASSHTKHSNYSNPQLQRVQVIWKVHKSVIWPVIYIN